jgi:hypothetical protein
MNGEWMKILVSATAGMFTGLIADPIRDLIQSRFVTGEQAAHNLICWAPAWRASRVDPSVTLRAD